MEILKCLKLTPSPFAHLPLEYMQVSSTFSFATIEAEIFGISQNSPCQNPAGFIAKADESFESTDVNIPNGIP